MILFWSETPELFYLKCNGAYLTLSEYRLQTRLRPRKTAQNEWGKLDTKGRLTIYARYLWDGASGPTIDTVDSIIASLVHDFGYQLIRQGLLPADFKRGFDLLFYDLLKRDGMLDVRAFAWWRAVVRLGHGSTLPHNERPILRAPIPFPADDERPPMISPLTNRPA